MNETKLQAPEKFDFHAHLARQAAWSLNTFGPGMRTEGVCDHIRKELIEIQADPTDLAEWIDVVILGLDGAWRCGGTPDTIIAGIAAKQAKNEGRTWPDWRTADPTKAIEHVRTGEAAPAWSIATAPGPDGYQRTVAVPGMPSASDDISAQLREYASNPGYSHNDYADSMRQAADFIDYIWASATAPAAVPVDVEFKRLADAILQANTNGARNEALRGMAELFDRAAPAPVQQAALSGWQPIETAPKDGREVILTVERRAGIDCKQLVGHFMGGGHCIEGHPPIASGWYFWNGCMFDEAAKPTHWMPLPPAPAAAPAQPTIQVQQAALSEPDAYMAVLSGGEPVSLSFQKIHADWKLKEWEGAGEIVPLYRAAPDQPVGLSEQDKLDAERYRCLRSRTIERVKKLRKPFIAVDGVDGYWQTESGVDYAADTAIAEDAAILAAKETP